MTVFRRGDRIELIADPTRRGDFIRLSRDGGALVHVDGTDALAMTHVPYDQLTHAPVRVAGWKRKADQEVASARR